MAFAYIVRCADGSYDVGSTRASLEDRVAEHNAGKFDGYTALRRPVSLAWSEEFSMIADAIAVERQIKGWSRAKKTALIAGQSSQLKDLAKRRAGRSHPSRHASRAPQDED
jgi:putative endonuclease